MRGMFLYGLVLVFALLASAPLCAQEALSVDLDRGFAEALPLEVPFRLTGKAPPGVDRIEFLYAPSAAESPGYLPIPEPQIWTRIHGDEWSFVVLPLHHRKAYRFEWRLQLSVRSLERERPGVAAAATELVRDFVDDWQEGGLEIEAVRTLEDRIVRTLLGSATPAAGHVRLDRERIDAAVARTADVELAAIDFAANHSALCRDFPAALSGAGLRGEAALADALRRVAPAGGRLVGGSVSRWQGVLDPRDRNSGASLADVTALMVWLSEEPSLIADILQGRRTIHRESMPEIAPATPVADPCVRGGAEVGAIGLLAETLAAWPALMTGSGPVLDERTAAAARGWARELRAYRDDAVALRQLLDSADDALLQELTALTFDAPVQWTASATAVADRTHPYIGLDLGVGWMPGLDAAAFYSAAHVYAVPINRRAALGIHRGSDVLLKRVSLMFGLAVTGVRAQGREEAWSAGSPMLGVGLRLTRDVRASGGLLWYRDENGQMESTSFASLSLDIDLARFIGRLGRLFGS